jgi:hypothetical protein
MWRKSIALNQLVPNFRVLRLSVGYAAVGLICNFLVQAAVAADTGGGAKTPADNSPTTKFGGIGWGIGLAADFDIGGTRVNSATVVNNIVRVTDTSNNVNVGFVLEAHYFFKAREFGSTKNCRSNNVVDALNCTDLGDRSICCHRDRWWNECDTEQWTDNRLCVGMDDWRSSSGPYIDDAQLLLELRNWTARRSQGSGSGRRHCRQSASSDRRICNFSSHQDGTPSGANVAVLVQLLTPRQPVAKPSLATVSRLAALVFLSNFKQPNRHHRSWPGQSPVDKASKTSITGTGVQSGDITDGCPGHSRHIIVRSQMARSRTSVSERLRPKKSPRTMPGAICGLDGNQ